MTDLRDGPLAQSIRARPAAESRKAFAGAEARGQVVLAVAPNGGRKTKADHPALPLSPDELARTAAECLERGASMIHLHVRDGGGGHCLDPDAYRAAIARICREVGDRLVIQITSESLGLFTPSEQKAAVLEANPEAVSLALREFAPEPSDERDFGLFLGKLKQMRIWPQIILYHPDEAQRLGAMRKQGLIPFDKLSVLYVLGRFAITRTAIPRDLLPFLAPDMPRFEFVERVRLRPPRGRLRDRRRAARRPCASRFREQLYAPRRRPRRLQRGIGRRGRGRARGGRASDPDGGGLEGGDRGGAGAVRGRQASAQIVDLEQQLFCGELQPPHVIGAKPLETAAENAGGVRRRSTQVVHELHPFLTAGLDFGP